MSKVDSRIVTMKFDNAQFERGVATTMATMDKLKKSLTFENAKKGLGTLQDGINKVSFGHMEGGIDGISKKFMAMSTVGITAIAGITSKVVDAGLAMANSLTLAPIKAGFDEYELKMGSIQTILANTSKFGTKLPDVTKALDELNTYADKTIYNFGDMTKNIGLFTNAGIKIEDATSMIKGFSNSAAASGTNAEGAASAAYQLSQALSSGKVTLMDWKSLTNVGMGNKNMQEGIIDIAKAMGTFKGTGIGAKDAAANFNSTLEKGWLTADVMSNYLQIMAGDMDAAKMAAMGLSAEQIKMFQAQQKTAEEAATKVRTFSQLIGTMREAVGSGWSETFGIVIGNFDEATELFTSINNVVSDFIGKSAEARNKVLGDWKALGGRTMLIAGIKNIFEALGNIIKPIRDAFRELFPKKTGEDLYKATAAFTRFTDKLKLSDEGMANLKSTFKGVFAVFSIFSEIIKGALGLFGKLASAFFNLGGTSGKGILAFTGGLGEAIAKFAEFIKSSGIITRIFDGIAAVLTPIIRIISKLRTAIFTLAGGGIDAFVAKWQQSFAELKRVAGPVVDKLETMVNFVKDNAGFLDGFLGLGKQADDSITKVGAFSNALAEPVTAMDRVTAAWDKVQAKLAVGGDFFERVWESIKKGFSALKDKVVEFVKGLGIQEALALVNTGFFIMLYRAFTGFTKNMSGVLKSASQMFDNVGGVLKQTTSNLKTMQTDIRANILLKIAIAIAILAAAIFVLSKIDPAKLGIALGAITIMIGELIGAIMLLEKRKDTSVTGGLRVAVMAAAFIGLAAALVLLALAISILGRMDLGELTKGVVTIGIIMAAVTAMALALEISGSSKAMLTGAAAILVLSIALVAFAGALKLYSMLDTGMMLEGGLKIAATLSILGLIMKFLMPETMLKNAAALVILSVALIVMAEALKRFGSIGLWEMAKGLFAMGASLLIIAVALNAMKGTAAGSAALLVAAVALVVIAEALTILGQLSVAQIVAGLLTLVAVFVILGVVAAVFAATGIIFVIMALGQALIMMGVAMLAAGAGMLLFAMGLAALAISGAAGFAVLTAGIVGFLMLLPLMAQQLGLAIIAFAKVLIEGAPVFFEAMAVLIDAFLRAMTENLPEFGEFMMEAIETLLAVLVEEIPNIIKAGWEITLSLINGLAEKLPELGTAATNLVTSFLDTMGNRENIDKIIDSGSNMVVNIMNGISAGIDEHSEEIGDAGRHLAGTLISGMYMGLTGGEDGLMAKIRSVAGGMVGTAAEVFKSHSPSLVFMEMGESIGQGLEIGIDSYADIVNRSVLDMGNGAIETMKSTMAKMADVISEDVDVNPTITPVLDLSKVQRDAANINSMLAANSLAAEVSYNQASSISASHAAQMTVPETVTTTTAPTVQFEQNNYSPKALSTVDIYRQTRNQLALAKEALKV